MLIFFPPFHRCFATHPSLWLFQLVPANDCDLFNLACDEGPSNSPQSPFKAQKSREWKQCCCHGYLLAASSVYRKPPQWTALAVPNPEPGWEGWSCLETRGGLSSTKPRLLAGERATKGSTQTQCSPLCPCGWVMGALCIQYLAIRMILGAVIGPRDRLISAAFTFNSAETP